MLVDVNKLYPDVYKSAYQKGYSDAMRDFRKEPKTDVLLDKIKAEIKEHQRTMMPVIPVQEVFEIIDKYGEQELNTGYHKKSCDTCENSDEIDVSNCYECVKDMRDNYSPKFCDRNICLSNEYSGIGCEECEVTKSQKEARAI